VSLGSGLWLSRRAGRADLARAAWVLFGAWAVVHAVVFSFQQGTFHPYYVSALMPAVAALCGAGIFALLGWAARSAAGVAALAVGVVGSALEAIALLGDYAPAVSIAIPVAAAVALLALTMSWRRVAAVAAVVAVLAGPATWTYATVGRSLNGNNVTGGPATTAQFGGGGMGDSGATDSALADYLVEHQGSAKYLVAATGSQTTAPIIIATGKAVVTIGGFTGSDPAPTVSELGAMVERGELKYVLLGGGGGGRGGNSEITAWVQAHGTEVSGVSTSGGTLYKVTA
jgi:4-amino-4-deoxy-L-arabinose transferase-like glycosyltransferase